MSRIGKQPVPIPAGVKVTIKDGKVTVAGPKASKPLEFVHHRNINECQRNVIEFRNYHKFEGESVIKFEQEQK